LDDLTAEVERITLAAAAGKVRSLGNWSPAQAIWHIGKLIELSFDAPHLAIRYQAAEESTFCRG